MFSTPIFDSTRSRRALPSAARAAADDEQEALLRAPGRSDPGDASRALGTHPVTRLLGPIQLQQDINLPPPLCALVYSYLSHAERRRLLDPHSRYQRDMAVLRDLLPAPGLGAVRLRDELERMPVATDEVASLNEFAGQVRDAVSRDFTRNALIERLNQRDALLSQARSQRYSKSVEDLVSTYRKWDPLCKMWPGALELLLGTQTLPVELQRRGVALAIAMVMALTCNVSRWPMCEDKLIEVVRGNAPARRVPTRETVMLGVTAVRWMSASIGVALYRAAVESDGDYGPLCTLGSIAIAAAVVTLAELIIAALARLVESRRATALELELRADETGVLGHHRDDGRSAVVYFDRLDRLAVDSSRAAVLLAPQLFTHGSSAGLNVTQLALRESAIALCEALEQCQDPTQVADRMASFDALLVSAGDLHPADRSVGARALRLLLREVRDAREAYAREQSVGNRAALIRAQAPRYPVFEVLTFD